MADQESNASRPLVDFMEMRNVLVLAAFAAEARRVLSEIDFAVSAIPDLKERFSQMVEARSQWLEYEDTIPEVLDSVARQLEALANE